MSDAPALVLALVPGGAELIMAGLASATQVRIASEQRKTDLQVFMCFNGSI
jgi:hypothetical protein